MSTGAGVVGGGDGGDESGTGILSTSASTSGTISSPSGGPLLPHLVPPPGPAVGEQKRSAWLRIAPWTGPECI